MCGLQDFGDTRKVGQVGRDGDAAWKLIAQLLEHVHSARNDAEARPCASEHLRKPSADPCRALLSGARLSRPMRRAGPAPVPLSKLTQATTTTSYGSK